MEFPMADFGNLEPKIEEKLTAQLSKNAPSCITNVLPPPPSGLFHESDIIEAFLDFSKPEYKLII
jgi:hypothetical protein